MRDTRPLRYMLANMDESFLENMWKKTWDVGGPHFPKTVRDPGTVHWITENMRRNASSGMALPELCGRALHQIVTEHPFMDCNHRTGWFFCETTLRSVGYSLIAGQQDVVRFVKAIDSQHYTVGDVVLWIEGAFVLR